MEQRSIVDNENCILQLGATLQPVLQARERLKSVSNAFGMSNFTLMPIDSLQDKAERDSAKLSNSETWCKDALKSPRTVSARAGSQPPDLHQIQRAQGDGAHVTTPLLGCSQEQATAQSPVKKLSTLSVASAKKQQDGAVQLYRQIWNDFGAQDIYEPTSNYDTEMETDSYTSLYVFGIQHQLTLTEELADSRVSDQLSANNFKIIAALESQDAEAFVHESAQQKCPRVELEQISYPSNIVQQISIQESNPSMFSAFSDPHQVRNRAQSAENDLVLFAQSLTNSFHANKILLPPAQQQHSHRTLSYAVPTQHGHHWSPQIKPSQPPLCLNELLYEQEDISLLMPESLDALLVEVGEDYGLEADEDLQYFEEYGGESDYDVEMQEDEEVEGDQQMFLTQAF